MISATRVTCAGPYTRRPATPRAGVSNPISSQCRSTCVASPKRAASSPIVYSDAISEFMSTLIAAGVDLRST
jgi:hypothetical protein